MAKKQYPEDFKTMFGVSVMGMAQMLPAALIGSYLILYITDYSGLYAGVAGKAAGVAAVMLLVGRIWDAINDPLLGFVIDRAPRRKLGKFKPFMLWFTLIATILIIALFNIPMRMPDVVKVIWLYVVYFLFDTAYTMLPGNPLIQTLTDDAEIRSKLLIAPRIVSLVLGAMMSFFMTFAIAMGPDGETPNFGFATLVVMIPLAAISLLGIALVKEGTHGVDEEPVVLKDAVTMFKENKPLLFAMLGYFFGGFIFNFFTASSTYYIKYAFGPERLSTLSAVMGGIMIAYGTASIPLIILFLMNLAGPITSVPLFTALVVFVFLGNSLAFLPWQVIFMECMDYNKYKMGKSMQGMVNSMGAFIGKLQAALGAALTGGVLVAVGYDAELYKDATSIPPELFNGLGLVLFGVPALVAVISLGAMYFYPLRTKAQRDKVYAEIGLDVPGQEEEVEAAPAAD